MAGDSGSLVVDARTAEFYGYIVSGDPTLRLAYIMPAYEVFDDIEKRFGVRPSLVDNFWTEISKDLVSADAIKGAGWEYKETEDYYYVMEYLEYVSHKSVD